MDQLLKLKGKEMNKYLNEGTRSRCIGNEQPHIIRTPMSIQPINVLFGHLDEQCPNFRQGELEVRRNSFLCMQNKDTCTLYRLLVVLRRTSFTGVSLLAVGSAWVMGGRSWRQRLGGTWTSDLSFAKVSMWANQ